MKYLLTLTAGVCLLAQASAPSLIGTVTDPSGALIPNALVQVFGPGGQRRATTNEAGQYQLDNLPTGKYTVRFIAKGFAVLQRKDVNVQGQFRLDAQLLIEVDAQVLNVEEEANRVTVDPGSNSSAVVLREKELAALSDDPDELAQQLQALAGPSAGPNGGQIFIDGFTGRSLPSKSSIREVRINSNPYAPEFDRPGFGRIEILTKPGSDTIRGQLFYQFNNQNLNSRNPLLQQSTRPPYSNQFFGANLSGPIKTQKASYGLDFERRNIDENAFVFATTLDANLNPQTVNQGIVTPQTRTNFSPRLDYQINATNTLVARYQFTRVALENEGIGSFSLTSRAFDQRDTEQALQLTETAILGTKAVNETRFQYLRSNIARTGDNSVPALNVQGAFEGGGAQVGNSGAIDNRMEVSNLTTFTHGAHTVKWGARLRFSRLSDTSVNNFGGTYTFFGGLGPVLDANNQPTGVTTQLTALERYRRTLLFRSQGASAARIRELGGGAAQFSLSAGTPTTEVNQVDAGLFIGDDWRWRPRVTISYGLRYEMQNNMSDWSNWAPRVGLAWALDGGGGRPSKTVLRFGYGFFFDRLAENVTLQARRFDGVTQQSYLLRDPDSYPAIPALTSLEQARQPQRLQWIDGSYNAPRLLQGSVSIERQVTSFLKISAQYMNGRGINQQRSRNINSPVNGVYPFGDRQLRVYTESSGFSRTNTLVISPSVNYKKLFVFGFYSYGNGRNNTEGQPADPYNLQNEWGPSTFGDIRHRFIMGTGLPLPLKFTISPFFLFSSGVPYNLTTGRDTNGDGFTAERPALVAGRSASDCRGASLVYTSSFGCFDLSGTGTPIDRNFARGPATANLSLRLSRTWAFGNRGESGPADGGGLPPGMGGARGGPSMGGPGGPGGGGPPPGMGGGPPPGLFGPNSGKKYNLMLSVSARNVLNGANYAPPSGDLSSPFFGEYRSLAGFGPFGGSSTFNRKIDVQLRFTF